MKQLFFSEVFMNAKVSKLQKSFAVIWLLGAIMVAYIIAPYNPPTWSDGILYPLWWLLVLWAVLIASITPIGIVVTVSFILFKVPFATFVTVICVWIFDYYMRINFPMVMMTPQCAFAALYVFVVLKDYGRIKFE